MGRPEDERVKIPALIHLTRLEYDYLSLKTNDYDGDTNIYINAKVTTVARSTVGHLSDADFSKQPILVPDKLGTAVFDAYLDKIVSLRKENHELSTLRDWLLPMLMNGQAVICDMEETMNLKNPRFL